MAKTKPTKAEGPSRTVVIDKPEGKLKPFGGSAYDEWNSYITTNLGAALPGGNEATDRGTRVTTAACIALMEMKPENPVEAMIGAQMIAAQAASLDLLRRAWIDEQPFEVRTRYLALADKSARTVAMLAESLAKLRSGGKQTVVVKHQHVHVADGGQAVVAGEISADRGQGGGGHDGGK